MNSVSQNDCEVSCDNKGSMRDLEIQDMLHVILAIERKFSDLHWKAWQCYSSSVHIRVCFPLTLAQAVRFCSQP